MTDERPEEKSDETEVPTKVPTKDSPGDEDREKTSKDDDDLVDEASKDSFPTSDPPSW